MKSAFQLTGMLSLRRRFARARQNIKAANRRAIEESIIYLNERALGILDAEVYGKQRAPFAEELTYELYSSWVHKVHRIGSGALAGDVTNTSDHAGFLEFGTDNEGTGTHEVPVSVAKALHWINPETGGEMFANKVTVQGIKPLHFMERALTENTVGVRRIYQKHYAHIFSA